MPNSAGTVSYHKITRLVCTEFPAKKNTGDRLLWFFEVFVVLVLFSHRKYVMEKNCTRVKQIQVVVLQELIKLSYYESSKTQTITWQMESFSHLLTWSVKILGCCYIIRFNSLQKPTSWDNYYLTLVAFVSFLYHCIKMIDCEDECNR